ncbi:MAG: RNA methyltransferase [Clostridiales bacterium]|nr:RNA methyltransferase [Clostridiales bacterium]
MINITSAQNQLVKEVKSLKNSRDRQEKGLFFIEGTKSFGEALNSGAEIQYVVISDGLLEAFGCDNALWLSRVKGEVYCVPDKLFESISDTESPQGILAVLKNEKKFVSEIQNKNGLYMILDEVRDPGNLGTIIRTADAAGFSGVIVSKGCADIYNPKVLRATMGSIFHIPIYHCGEDELSGALKHLENMGIMLLASHLEGSKSIYDMDLTKGTAIIVGNEASGISETAVKAAAYLVSIPMAGRAESLNAAVAAGIMMFEAVRQRGNKI